MQFQKGHTLNVGRKHTPQAKKNMGKAKIGFRFSEEAKQKISLAKIGKISNSKGKKWSTESRKKLSEILLKKGLASFKGKKHTEETKKKMSLKKLQNSSRYWKNKKFNLEHRKKLSISHQGARSAFWQGGISFEPYSVDWTKTLRISIRERDNYTCKICNKKQEERTFSVHHIDYNKKNCNPKNLITLCNACHLKTNHHRSFWLKYFYLLIN